MSKNSDFIPDQAISGERCKKRNCTPEGVETVLTTVDLKEIDEIIEKLHIQKKAKGSK